MNIEKWIAFIRSALGAAGRIGLLLHEYGGGIAAEQLTVTRTSIPASRLDKEVLLTMKQDVVYEISH